MGFQFVHMQTYSRKPSKAGVGTSFVFGEAQRRPECCTHVEVPGEPVTVYGMDVAAIELEHDTAVEAARSVNVKGQARKLRQDQHTLLTVIASHPVAPDQVRDDPSVALEVQDWENRTIAWLKEAYGDELRGVIRHDDEGHIHLHAYVIPGDPGMSARALHPGVQAKKAFMASEAAVGLPELTANRLGDKAYKAAMREWQDSYWRDVGLVCGLTRIGPGRRRLSRADWQAEQAQAERVASLQPLLEQVDKMEAAVGRGEAMIHKLRNQVAAAVAERDASIRAAEKAKQDADAAATDIIAKARKQAASTLAGARREGERLKGIGTALGAFVQGVLGASPSKIEALVRADERQIAAIDMETVRSELKDVRRELRGERQSKTDIVDSLQRVADQRDAAWAVLNDNQKQALAYRQNLTVQ